MAPEIKFRCWDNINKKWLNLFRILLATNGEIIAVETLDGEQYGLHQVELIDTNNLALKNLMVRILDLEEHKEKLLTLIEQYGGQIAVFEAENKRLKDIMQDATMDYGYANSWGQEPLLVTECKAAGHKRNDTRSKPFGHDNEVCCRTCRYIYRYDSS